MDGRCKSAAYTAARPATVRVRRCVDKFANHVGTITQLRRWRTGARDDRGPGRATSRYARSVGPGRAGRAARSRPDGRHAAADGELRRRGRSAQRRRHKSNGTELCTCLRRGHRIAMTINSSSSNCSRERVAPYCSIHTTRKASCTLAALHQGAPGQMTWLEDPPPLITLPYMTTLFVLFWQ